MSQSYSQSNNKANKPLPDGYAFYKSIGSPKFICAPMVEQSEVFHYIEFIIIIIDYIIISINSYHFDYYADRTMSRYVIRQ